MIRRRQQPQAAPSSTNKIDSMHTPSSTTDLEQTPSIDNNNGSMSAYRGSSSRHATTLASNHTPTPTMESFSVLSGASSDMNSNERKPVNMSLSRNSSSRRQRQWMLMTAVVGGFFFVVLLLLQVTNHRSGSSSRSNRKGEEDNNNNVQTMMLSVVEIMASKKTRRDGCSQYKFWLIMAMPRMGELLLWTYCVKLVQSNVIQYLEENVW
jgi:hypothetical protein